MKNLIICIILMMLGICPCQAQQQGKSSTGKTFVVKATKSEASRDSITGVTITLKDGKTYPVYKGSRGGLYTWRIAKKGQHAGQRIKVSLSSAMSKEEYAELKKMCSTK